MPLPPHLSSHLLTTPVVPVHPQAATWAQGGPLFAVEVATLLRALVKMGASWAALEPPLRAAVLLGVVAAGDADRLHDLEVRPTSSLSSALSTALSKSSPCMSLSTALSHPYLIPI
jgi:hypothetical protein